MGDDAWGHRGKHLSVFASDTWIKIRTCPNTRRKKKSMPLPGRADSDTSSEELIHPHLVSSVYTVKVGVLAVAIGVSRARARFRVYRNRLVINKGGEREGRRGRATYGGAPPRVGPHRHRHGRPWHRSRAVGVPPRNQHPNRLPNLDRTPISFGFG